MYFILPDIVYHKFEEILGDDIPVVDASGRETLTVYTYKLGPAVAHGSQRTIERVRELRFTLKDLSERFISGPNLPDGEELDIVIRKTLGVD